MNWNGILIDVLSLVILRKFILILNWIEEIFDYLWMDDYIGLLVMNNWRTNDKRSKNKWIWDEELNGFGWIGLITGAGGSQIKKRNQLHWNERDSHNWKFFIIGILISSISHLAHWYRNWSVSWVSHLARTLDLALDSKLIHWLNILCVRFQIGTQLWCFLIEMIS